LYSGQDDILPIFHAAQNGHLEVIKYFHYEKTSPLFLAEKQNCNLLYFACNSFFAVEFKKRQAIIDFIFQDDKTICKKMKLTSIEECALSGDCNKLEALAFL
jgi:hypothetical protein